MKLKPFLKWAGGKYRVLGEILKELPQGSRFVEPFAGSCAVYLNCAAPRALVCDINPDLVALYRHIQTEGEEFISYCGSFFTPENNARENYLRMRAFFNSATEPRVRAAVLLYLNRHSFNGLVRYNSKRAFNVPFGKYKLPYFPLKELRDFHRKTREIETEFACGDFREIFTKLRPGDVVYCDPPYAALSATARFTNYAGSSFTERDQRDLAALAKEAHGRGIPVILSNHNTERTRALYPSAEFRQFTVQRNISRDGRNRSPAPEMLAIYRS